MSLLLATEPREIGLGDIDRDEEKFDRVSRETHGDAKRVVNPGAPYHEERRRRIQGEQAKVRCQALQACLSATLPGRQWGMCRAPLARTSSIPRPDNIIFDIKPNPNGGPGIRRIGQPTRLNNPSKLPAVQTRSDSSRLLKKSVRLRDKGGRGDFLRVDGAHF
jgi:hypothetical protein